MSKNRQSDAVPVPMMLISDFFGLLLSLLPVTGNYLFMFYLGQYCWSTPLFIPFVLFFPWLAALSFFVILFSLRMCFPRMRPGVFAIGFNPGFMAWSLNFYLNRAISLSGLKNFIFSNNTLRFMYLRTMGGKFPFQMNGSMGITFMDIPLLEAGKGSTFSEGVTIAAHSFTGEALWLAPVKIGQNVFLGMEVIIGPGTTIGERSWVGSQNVFLKDKIPAESQFPNFAWQRGNPAKAEKSEVRLGSDTKSVASAEDASKTEPPA